MKYPRSFAPSAGMICAGILFGLALSCSDRLVDERYATTGAESINGLDAFYKLLEEAVVHERGGEIIRTGSLTNRVRTGADLVVYFERDFVQDHEELEYYRNLEAYLFDYDPDELRVPDSLPADIEQVPSDDEFELEDSAEPVEIRQMNAPAKKFGSRFALQEESGQASPEQIPDDVFDEVFDDVLENDSLDSGESEGPDDRYKTILYFLKDTDASVAFWQRLAEQMREYPKQRAYCEQQLKAAHLSRSLDSIPYLAPLSSRRTEYAGGELVENLRWNRAVFPEKEFPARGLRYPVRTVPGPVLSHLDVPEAEDVVSRSLLATGDGRDLIRELELPFARLILIYNSESFLNHSQVHPGNRRLARYLLRHSLSLVDRAGSEAPTAAVVRALVKTATAARDDFDMLRFLKVFPLNVIVIHFFVLLALFLLSRWPHSGPPLENQSAGNREFLEHIKALGVRLSRTTPRMKALEPLLRYKQKTTGRDYTAIIHKLEEAFEAPPESKNAGVTRDRNEAPS